MRKIDDVINEVLTMEEVPDGLKDRLRHVLEEKLPWCPPENVGLMWHECQIFVNGYLPRDPKELVDWQRKFLKVWTGRDF
jgi:hypothetical protein